MLYSEDIWDAWVAKLKKDYTLKKYDHFDYQFDFLKRDGELKDLLSNPDKVNDHPFIPLIKILIKTPRYRYQEDEKEYGLETKIRPISFASHFDTYIYNFYSFTLGNYYQNYIRKYNFSDCVLAYRNDLDGKCNIQFSKGVFDYIKLKGPCTAINLDIKGYFDSIDHQILKSKWSEIINDGTIHTELPPDQYKLFRSITKYSYVNKTSILKHFNIDLRKIKKTTNFLDYIPGKGFKEKFQILRDYNLITTNKSHEIVGEKKRFYGIPQGLSISALLSNVYLIDYDKILFKKSIDEGFLYRRYCDDILIICDTVKSLDLQDFAIKEIEKFHLIIQPKKVELIEFTNNSRGNLRAFNLKKIKDELPSTVNKSNEQKFYKNLQYLGFEFNGKSILIRPGSLSRYFRKMKARLDKSVKMAYSENSKSYKVFKQQLFHRYTHLGKRNFLRYAYNSSKEFYQNSERKKKEGMNSPAIKKQLSRHFDILIYSLTQKVNQRK